MDIDKETSEKLQELQTFEQHMQGILMEKQSLQIEVNEINNALNELEKISDEVYKILGGIMIRSDKKNIINDLKERQKILGIKISAVEKQESLINERANLLRKEINKKFVKNNKQNK